MQNLKKVDKASFMYMKMTRGTNNHYGNHTLHALAPPLQFHPLQRA